MKWKDIGTRLTGLSTPIGGASWEYVRSERSAVEDILIKLEDKRVLYELTEYEVPKACEASIEAIRSMLDHEISDVGDMNSDLVVHLRAMRSACREFLTAIQRKSLAVDQLDEYAYPANHWEFIEALANLRRDVGYRIAALSARYAVDVPDALTACLPPQPEPD
jgi:hypothetical protein